MLGICLKYQQRNYGSKLQALATIKKLEQLGVDYEIIRYNKKTPLFILKYFFRFFNIVFLNDRYDQIQREICFRRHPEIKEKIDCRNELFAEFDTYFTSHLSGVYSSYETLKRQCSVRYDGLLTCSDQLWSPAALGSGFFNLMFAPEQMPKISWASSFGVSEIPWYQKKRTQQYLRRIQNISMRENQGAEIVKKLTGRKVPVLMDPVFSFTKEEWEMLMPVEKPEWENYLFCYFLGDNPEYRTAAKQIAVETGMKIVTLRHLDRYIETDEQFGDYAPYDVDPNRFLNILRHASCVLTDSFHGTAFSILNEKPFVVFDRYSNDSANSKNSRVDSLCENLQLQERRFSQEKGICRIMEQPIDYEAVKEILGKYREETTAYLKNALNI